MRQTDECTRMYLLSFPRLRPSIAGKHVSLRDGKRCRYPERGKKTACLSNSRLESQSTVVIVCSSCLSFSLSLSCIHPRAILKSSTCSTGRGGGGEEGWRVHGITTTMRARRTVYNSVATSCADTRHSTMVQRMDPRAGYSIFGKRERSAELSNRGGKEKGLRPFFFSIYFLKSLRYGKLRIFIP